MKRFNPEKELNKIKNGNKNKIIVCLCALLLIVVVGYSFALYQVRHTNNLVYTVVKPFSNKDIILAVHLDDELSNKFPEKGKGYYYDRIECDNKEEGYTKASWNNSTWSLTVNTQGPNKCDVYFTYTDEYRDNSEANLPELYQGLIPIYYDEVGKIYFADLHKKWYDYDQHEWANAVLVDASNPEIKNKYFQEDGSFNQDAYNKEIPIDDILQMYVWIPRYKYQIFNITGNSINPQEIKIKFETNTQNSGDITCTYENLRNGSITETCVDDEDNPAQNGEWYTHPAFTFGDTELPGIWVGKFEPSGNVDNITIKPSLVSLRPDNVETMFNATRNIELQNNVYNLETIKIDTHMAKNVEWAAISYLSHSKYGRCTENGSCSEITINSRNGYVTGYDNSNSTWNTTNGVRASTTNNIYGIYDINGGSTEYVMGIMTDELGALIIGQSGFLKDNFPDNKYYDIYSYGTSNSDYKRGHLGDATRETYGWYGDHKMFVNSNSAYFIRSGYYTDGSYAGAFYFYTHSGNQVDSRVMDSFRVVLTAQDGNE